MMGDDDLESLTDDITISGSDDIKYQDWLDTYIGNINIDEASWNYEPKIGANDISLTGFTSSNQVLVFPSSAIS